MSRDDMIVLGTFYGLLALAIFGAVMGHRHSSEYRGRCEAAGGLPFKPRSDWVCLQRDQLVRLP